MKLYFFISRINKILWLEAESKSGYFFVQARIVFNYIVIVFFFVFYENIYAFFYENVECNKIHFIQRTKHTSYTQLRHRKVVLATS